MPQTTVLIMRGQTELSPVFHCFFLHRQSAILYGLAANTVPQSLLPHACPIPRNPSWLSSPDAKTGDSSVCPRIVPPHCPPKCSSDPLQSTDIYAGRRDLGLSYNHTTYFTAQDGQGTVRARTDIDGNLMETCTSLPFGDSLTCSYKDGMPGYVDRVHFTGQMHDWTDNLDHFMYRQYTN